MYNRKLMQFVCLGILSATTGGLVAQQSSTDRTTPGATPPGSSQSGISSQSRQLGSSANMRGQMQTDHTLRLSEVLNKPVQTQDGKNVGTIRDLTVDPQSGQIEFAILALTSSLSSQGGASDASSDSRPSATGSQGTTPGTTTIPGSRASTPGASSTSQGTSAGSQIASSSSAGSAMGKLIPVPWQLFSQSGSSHSASSSSATSTRPSTSGLAQSAHGLVLNIDESKLRNAPSFDSSDWNQLQTGSLDQRVYSHFGVDRSSGIGTPGSSIRGQGSSGTSDPNRPSSNLPGSRDRSSQPRTGPDNDR